ncbi:MAG: LamG-like jellyroll fold domain-containing protein, partial [Nanoarchaeota archaeon]
MKDKKKAKDREGLTSVEYIKLRHGLFVAGYKRKQEAKKLSKVISDYESGIISDTVCLEALNTRSKGKKPDEWLDTYTDVINKSQARLSDNKVKPNYKLILPIIILLAITGLFLLQPALTGFVSVTKEFSYTDEINIKRNQTSEYLWILSNTTKLNSIRLNGRVSTKGTAKVFIEHNDESHLIFDSETLLLAKGLPGITGLAVTALPELGNNSIRLEYKSGTVYDEDNNGIEYTDSIVDFTVENSGFNGTNICTQWIVDSDESISKICYGDKQCCNFLGLEPTSSLWNDIFYLNHKAYGAGYNNTVNAQIINIDYNLSLDNPYSNIMYSDIAALSAIFIPEFIDFSGICIETCSLSGFNASMYNLIIEIDDATLELDSIKYSTNIEVPNRPPVFNAMPSYKIGYGNDLNINLSNYAYDLDNDTLHYTSSNASGLTIFITNDIVNIIPDFDFIGKRYLYFIANDSVDIAVSNTIEINVVKDVIVNRTESVKQGIAVIGKPVKWTKNVKLNDTAENITVNVSTDAINFTVKKIRWGVPEEIDKDKIKVIYGGNMTDVDSYNKEKKLEIIDTEIDLLEDEKKNKALDRQALEDINKKLIGYQNEKNKITGYAVKGLGDGLLTRLSEWLFNVDITGYTIKEKDKKSKKNKTIKLVINETVEEIEVEYYTEAPTAKEFIIDDKTKQIIVSSDVHYENILTYTNITPEAPRNSIKLYWLVNNTRIRVEFEAYDRDSNGLMDYIQWITPSLSNQTYELVIEITKAEHLDENKAFISDIYDYVKVKDGNWSEVINDSEYVRVTFELPLDNTRDITIYARSAGQTSSIEIYEIDGNEAVAVIYDISSEGWYKTYLTGLNGTQDIFDLKVIGSVEIDYIVDPAVSYNISFVAPTPEDNTITSNTSFEINVSITNAADLDEVIYNWNGTNYTIYNDSLVLMFNFDNVSELGENDTHVFDISGGGNNGTVVGENVTTADGKYGKAMMFDGSNDYVLIKDNPSMDSVNFSVAFWMNPALVSDDCGLVTNVNLDGQYDGWAVAMDRAYAPCGNGKICVWLSTDSSGEYIDYTYDPPVGSWTHIGVTYTTNSNNVSIYINGKLVLNESASTVPVMSNTDNAHIGHYFSSYYYKGLMDEVRIWNRSLSPAEIQIIYMSNLKKYNSENWSLYINQSKNAIDILPDGTYTYKAYAKDTAGNLNQTETRTITVDAVSPFYITDCSTLDTAGATYLLTADITDSVTSSCMSIIAKNVTLDCQGHTIDGDGFADYGIRVETGALTTANATIKNCIVTGWDTDNIILFDGDANRLENVTASSSATGDKGIWIKSDWNTLVNVTSYNNGYGVFLDDSKNNVLIDVNLTDNTLWDFYVYSGTMPNDCNHKLINVNGTENKPIAFFNNSAITLDGWNNNVSAIILCNADGSVLNNITLYSTGTENNGIYLVETSSSRLTNIDVTDMYQGVALRNSHNNKMENITANSNSDDGINIGYSNYVSLNLITANENTDVGLALFRVTYSNFTNINASFNSDDGIDIGDSRFNIFESINVSFNTDDGIAMWTNNGAAAPLKNNLSGIHCSSNGDDGIILDGNNHTLRDSIISGQSGATDVGLRINYDFNQVINVTFANNHDNIFLVTTADSNIITNCTLETATGSGIYMNSPAGTTPNNIYNNIFNNTVNIEFVVPEDINYWNTTEQAGTRIFSDGVNIGGNYWTNSTGNGYSDTCTDADADGFCDSPYNVTSDTACTIGVNCGNNTDYHPLSNNYDAKAPTWENNKTNLTTITPFGADVYFNITLNDTNAANYTFSWYNGTDWENNSAASYSDGEEITVKKTINVKSDSFIINWTWYFNDTAGNINQTAMWSITIDNVNPGVNFTYPTPANDTTTSDTSFEINVSITESSLKEVIYNWNGTNYTIYNDSLVLMMNFDNVSALGENSTHIVDLSKYSN